MTSAAVAVSAFFSLWARTPSIAVRRAAVARSSVNTFCRSASSDGIAARRTDGVKDVVDHITVNAAAATTPEHVGENIKDATKTAGEEVKEGAGKAVDATKDIAREAMAEGLTWGWETFAEYLDAIDRVPKGVNYAASIGHSAL